MLSLRGCTLWMHPCSGWPSPAQWGCPCPALRAAPPMPPCAGTWLPETTFMTCPISATCMPTAPSSSTPSLPPPITALSTTTSTSALLRTRQARFEAPASTSKQVRGGLTNSGRSKLMVRERARALWLFLEQSTISKKLYPESWAVPLTTNETKPFSLFPPLVCIRKWEWVSVWRVQHTVGK